MSDPEYRGNDCRRGWRRKGGKDGLGKDGKKYVPPFSGIVMVGGGLHSPRKILLTSASTTQRDWLDGPEQGRP